MDPDAKAVAMAWICAVVSVENWLMAPTVLIPVWIMEAVAFFLLLVARGPWQPLQSVVYSAAPSTGDGVGVGVGVGVGADDNAAAIA